ncbi:hypothetical protein HZC31_03070 [Candidatus Woesearchaeota archaeon]|nr:hypothetical protein [Candidatus Woesearchaeota archaeon]
MTALNKAEVARSIELYLATQTLQEHARAGTLSLELTKEPLFRKREDVDRVVVAFGSYDPLTRAHEALFMRGVAAAQQVPLHQERSESLDELLIVTSTVHFDKKPDWTKNAALYDRVHALEGFASCYGNVALGLFNRPFFADLIDGIRSVYQNAEIYFVLGVDVLEKVVDPVGYERKGLDPSVMVELSMRARYLVSERSMKTQGGEKVVTLNDLREKYPSLLDYENRTIAIDLQGKYDGLDIPIQDVSSTLIRTRRNARLPVEYLEAVGISDFVDRRSMYLENPSRYAAFVYARQRFVDENKGKPIGHYIGALMEHLERMESDEELRAEEIRRAELKF